MLNRLSGNVWRTGVRTLGLSLVSAFAMATWQACSSADTQPQLQSTADAGTRLAPDEGAFRKTFGIPPEAATIVVFGQNAHLDIDWQHTFADYYSLYVEDDLIEARKILDTQPRAYYSVAEMAFLEHHLETHPEELAPLKAHAATGALRIVGGGMTSPDTLLPETELLMRDWLYGIQFAEDTLGAHPHSAWLPDSFGHSSVVPDVLAAAGYDSVAFSRVDGAPTLLERILNPKAPNKPGSTAEQLENLGTADFYWHGPGGGRVLAHWMQAPGLYCMGDNIDYQESLETPGAHVGPFAGDNTDYTDGQIDKYVSQMTAFAKTPYMFVPVGCDFAHPKPELIQYLDGYNQRRYPTTGVWAVAAPFEDYAKLVSFRGSALPELSVDITPYFMGFYGTRADVKRAVRDAARPFFVAETFASALGAQGQAFVKAAAPALKLLTRGDHHDFVTGTSTDDVAANEQMPLLATAQAAGANELTQVAAAIAGRIPATTGAVARILALNASSAPQTDIAEVSLPITAGVTPAFHAVAHGTPVPLTIVGTPLPTDTTATARLALSAIPPFSWLSIDVLPGAVVATPVVTLDLLDATGAPATGAAIVKVVLTNSHVRAEWNKKTAFALTSLKIDGTEAIAGDSFAIHDYQDTGGLWRTGNEMSGCVFSPLPDPTTPETVSVVDDSALMAHVAFTAGTTVREAILGAGATGLSFAITTGAAMTSTRTVSLSFAVPAGAKLTTSLAGGSAERAAEKVYTPTFWPAVNWAEVGGFAVLLRQSTGVRMSTPGQVELMAARDARTEQCDIEGGTGSDPGLHHIEWRIERAASAADAERSAQAFNRPIDLEVVPVTSGATTDLAAAQSLLSVDGDAIVSAIKPAERGDGVIVRALLLPGPATVHLSSLFAGRTLSAVDVAERDLRTVGPAGDTLSLDAKTWGSIASARLK